MDDDLRQTIYINVIEPDTLILVTLAQRALALVRMPMRRPTLANKMANLLAVK